MSYFLGKKAEITEIKYIERHTPYCSWLEEKDDYIVIWNGERSEIVRKILDEFVNGNYLNLERANESFCFIKYDKKASKVTFATSKFGMEEMWVYYDKEKRSFAVSDDFWEIVDFVKPTYADLDEDCIKETCGWPYGLFYTTYLKNVSYVPLASVGEFDVQQDKLLIQSYWDFRYMVDPSKNIESAMASMDKTFDSVMKNVKDKFGDVTYGIGLSGGLDSRILPHYALKNGMKVKSFLFGIKRPHGILKSRDHKNSEQLAKIFGIDNYAVEWKKENLDEKIKLDIQNYPLGSPQFFKYEKIDGIDVLLTGATGLVVGGMYPSDLNMADDEGLAKILLEFAKECNAKPIRVRRTEKAIKVLFGKDVTFDVKEPEWYRVALDKKTEENVKQKIEKLVKAERQKGKNNIDIFEKVFYGMIGIRNRNGSFESFCGKVRSFSIYVPYLFNETLTWPMEFFEDRYALKEFIKNYIPETAEVRTQNYEISVKEKNNLIHRVMSMADFLLRGNGTAVLQVRFRKCRKLFLRDMLSEGEWFYNILPIKKYVKDIAKCDEIIFPLKLWKTKQVVDYIENNLYQSFLPAKYDFRKIIGK